MCINISQNTIYIIESGVYYLRTYHWTFLAYDVGSLSVINNTFPARRPVLWKQLTLYVDRSVNMALSTQCHLCDFRFMEQHEHNFTLSYDRCELTDFSIDYL